MSISDELPANLSDTRTTAKIELLVAEESVILGGGEQGEMVENRGEKCRRLRRMTPAWATDGHDLAAACANPKADGR